MIIREECNTCEGKGEVLELVGVFGTPYGPMERHEYAICEDCDGEGGREIDIE